MKSIGGYKGWHIQAEINGATTSSLSYSFRVYASSGYSCAWGSRKLTVTCNGATKSHTINAMNNSGNAYSNTVSGTFTGLSAGTSYTISFDYPVKATLSGVYQKSWTGSLTGETTATYYLDLNG